ncbi:MAG: hypothetical protein LBN99_08010 [Oscillospiraceae bacterium]|jgi:uroporphyrinogen decarboxylase|nr:hypothetical protein [Oscillospiraceae bacterium]
MDKKTRVLNALNKKPVDHAPVGFWFHFFDKANDNDACVQAHVDYYNSVDVDFVKVMSDGYFGFPVDDVKVESVADLAKIKPIGKDHPWIREQVYRAKKVVEALGKDRLVFYTLFNPLTALRSGFINDPRHADEILTAYTKEDKETVKRTLKVVADGIVLLSEQIIKEAGCDGLYLSLQNAEVERFTAEEYNDIVAPSERYVLDEINKLSENNILHCCGFMGTPNRVSLWYDYPVKCVNWATAVENLPLYEGKPLFGDKAVLGGFDTHWEMNGDTRGIVYSGTKEEIQAYTRELIINTGKIGLLIGGDCTLEHHIDYERLRWIVEAAKSL